MESQKSYNLSFDLFWKRDVSAIRDHVLELWRHYGGPTGNQANARLSQIVYAVRDKDGQVAGLSTAFKVFVKQLGHHLFAVRLMLADQYRIPGLTSQLLVMTRDHLESI